MGGRGSALRPPAAGAAWPPPGETATLGHPFESPWLLEFVHCHQFTSNRLSYSRIPTHDQSLIGSFSKNHRNEYFLETLKMSAPPPHSEERCRDEMGISLPGLPTALILCLPPPPFFYFNGSVFLFWLKCSCRNSSSCETSSLMFTCLCLCFLIASL